MLALGAKAVLDQVGNLGQIAEIKQNQVHQREQIQWTRRGYHLDSQSLRLDALDHAKEEIRSHYDTYVGRIDTLLLVLALIWPFALNTIQFSDPFVPESEAECPDCVEVAHPWLVGLWIGLMAIILILPFWGILMLIRCKLKLDSWLEFALAGINRERRELIAFPQFMPEPANEKCELSRAALEASRRRNTEEAVNRLVNLVLKYQEYLGQLWTDELAWLVHASTMLLLMSALAALVLTSLSMWIFLANKQGAHAAYSTCFAVFIGSGCVAPALYVAYQNCRHQIRPPSHEADSLLHTTSCPLARTCRVSAADLDNSSGSSGLASPAEAERLAGRPRCWYGLCARRRGRGEHVEPLIPGRGSLH